MAAFNGVAKRGLDTHSWQNWTDAVLMGERNTLSMEEDERYQAVEP